MPTQIAAMIADAIDASWNQDDSWNYVDDWFQDDWYQEAEVPQEDPSSSSSHWEPQWDSVRINGVNGIHTVKIGGIGKSNLNKLYPLNQP